MNNEIFSYIGIPLNELNKEIKIQDQRVVLLFSYILNGYEQLNNQLYNYTNKIDKMSYILNDTNEHISKMEFRLGKVDKKINNIVSVLNISQQDLESDEEIKKPSKIKKIYNYIKYYIIKSWKSIYKFLFRKKISKKLEKQKRQQIEEENRKRLIQKEKIKKILKK